MDIRYSKLSKFINKTKRQMNIFIPKRDQYEFDICDNNNRVRLWPFILSLSTFKIDTPVKTWRMKYIFFEISQLDDVKIEVSRTLMPFSSTVLCS